MISREVKEAIEETGKKLILQLRMEGMLKICESKSAMQKAEGLLRSYEALKIADDRSAYWMAQKIESALKLIESDPYYRIIPEYYIEGRTREEIAEEFNTSPTTISRNKKRLMETVKMVLCSDETIKELYS